MTSTAPRDSDDRLITALTGLGEEYGADTVAFAAATLTDPAILVARLCMRPCKTCDGCGRVTDSPDAAAWTAFLDQPIESSFALLANRVRPVPCTECRGTGICWRGTAAAIKSGAHQ